MISTKNLITEIKEVPSHWVFNRYLNIGEPLTGQALMIKSIFNPKDKRPSMSVYVTARREYKFLDHSTGTRGSKIDLVMHMKGLTYAQAVDKIVDEYNLYLLNHDMPVKEFIAHARYSVSDYNRRKWTTIDKGYWTAYGIGSKELHHYGVYPLSDYTMSKGEHRLTITGSMIYGFFTESGELYKIYQPRALDRRFMKVKNYLQGWDQLECKRDTLIITKALKDIIVINNLELGEAIAPAGENNMIDASVIEDLRSKYSKIIVIFDNDDAGVRAMLKYQEVYKFPFIISPLGKDISDSVKDYGGDETLQVFSELITNKFNEEPIR